MRYEISRRALPVLLSALMLAATLGPAPAGAQGAKDRVTSEPTQAVMAPEFPSGLEWLNTDKPLSLRQLRGKIVLLDFWTYCCINCMHIIPDLKRLEAKYPNELVVIGVHSAKFTTERETESIRQAILRYEIHHPVVNDKDFRIWRAYGTRAWPTLVLIAPDGTVVGSSSGEGVFGPYDRAIQDVIRHSEPLGILDRRPLSLVLERDAVFDSVLSFPGKVLADERSGRLFIADTNHDRIVVASLADGTVLDVVGTGARGIADGGFDRARFSQPQGLALDGQILYVADTGNHSVRRVDLQRRTVDTLSGTGVQSQPGSTGGVGASVALNSPWDVLVRDGALYVAMAGSHQIWRVDLATYRAAPFAGSGREDLIDGPSGRAALAQPSGLATDGARLFVADSEVSAIRSVDLADGAVRTIVGRGLFEFGDVDGAGRDVRLQHPLGVVFAGGALFVADTYNNKVKRIDPGDGASRSFAGRGTAGRDDGDAGSATFDEPGGVSAANGKLYVADTNNHAIRVIDLQSRRVSTLRLRGLERLQKANAPGGIAAEVVELPERIVGPGEATVRFDVKLPSGYKLAESAPFYAALSSESPDVIEVPPAATAAPEGRPALPRSLSVVAKEGTSAIKLETVIYFCKGGDESLCYVRPVTLRVPIRVRAGAASTIAVTYALESPKGE